VPVTVCPSKSRKIVARADGKLLSRGTWAVRVVARVNPNKMDRMVFIGSDGIGWLN
jgi:hypothetical protein